MNTSYTTKKISWKFLKSFPTQDNTHKSVCSKPKNQTEAKHLFLSAPLEEVAQISKGFVQSSHAEVQRSVLPGAGWWVMRCHRPEWHLQTPAPIPSWFLAQPWANRSAGSQLHQNLISSWCIPQSSLAHRVNKIIPSSQTFPQQRDTSSGDGAQTSISDNACSWPAA